MILFLSVLVVVLGSVAFLGNLLLFFVTAAQRAPADLVNLDLLSFGSFGQPAAVSLHFTCNFF